MEQRKMNSMEDWYAVRNIDFVRAGGLYFDIKIAKQRAPD
jgi:hypothetical protein